MASALPTLTDEERDTLHSLVVVDPGNPGGCWGWLGTTDSKGYARVWLHGRHLVVCRLMYREIFNCDPITKVMHHGCGAGRYACVNPHHLSPIDRVRNAQMKNDFDQFEWESRAFLADVRAEARARKSDAGPAGA